MSETTPVVVSIINLKGGVGKTTVAVLLARDAAQQGLKVLAVDMDPQANMSQALMTEQEYDRFMGNREPSIVDLFNGYLPTSSNRGAPAKIGSLDQIMRQVGHGDNLHLIPSRFDFSDNLVSPLKTPVGGETILAKFISSEMQEEDLILIDCAPTESIITKAAYHASRYILIPVRPEFFATIGFPLMKKSLDDFKTRNGGRRIDAHVLINHPKTSGSSPSVHHRNSLPEIRTKASEYGWPIMRNEMYHSDIYPRLMNEPYIRRGYNAQSEFPPIADEFLDTIGLRSIVNERMLSNMSVEDIIKILNLKREQEHETE